MSETPTDLDAILESIRTRVTGEVAAAVAPPLAPLPAKAKTLLPTPLVDASGTTVEALFTALLEPLLRQWIDANLPEICERIAQAEIRRLTGQP
jgi:cell pole-organizing protein PopZ